MMDNFIQLQKDSVLRLGIKDANGNDTGEHLEFDLEDVELPLRYQELVETHKKNMEHIRNELIIIEKRQDVKGKKLLSKNEEDTIKALNNFFKKEVEVFNMFLGENGVQKLLNGRKLGWTTLQEIDALVKNQIEPYLDINKQNIAEKVKKTYGDLIDKKDNVLKDE